jgi:hypothetical protein
VIATWETKAPVAISRFLKIGAGIDKNMGCICIDAILALHIDRFKGGRIVGVRCTSCNAIDDAKGLIYSNQIVIAKHVVVPISPSTQCPNFLHPYGRNIVGAPSYLVAIGHIDIENMALRGCEADNSCTRCDQFGIVTA